MSVIDLLSITTGGGALIRPAGLPVGFECACSSMHMPFEYTCEAWVGRAYRVVLILALLLTLLLASALASALTLTLVLVLIAVGSRFGFGLGLGLWFGIWFGFG
tara:strand:+ start:104 stop:415 length:312 start_codon:yes stop_codon:yes gene_type:complete